MKIKYVALLTVIAVGLSASQMVNGTAENLVDKQGKKTFFVKADERALSVDARAAADKVRTRLNGAAHAGEVFYKHGVETPGLRYISTGRIVVKFDPNRKTDFRAFAQANGLVFVESTGREHATGVFVNQGGEDDVAVSNALIKNSAVLSVTPDWVLPLKLY